MNPTIAILLTLFQQIKPEDFAAIIAAIVPLVDKVIATKGPLVRWAWAILKTVLPTPQLATELQTAAAAHLASNPHLAAQVAPPVTS